MKFLKWLGLVLLLLIIAYFLGPQPSTPAYSRELPVLPPDPLQLEKYIEKQEGLYNLKPYNEARIIWANDSVKEKTPYAVVYIHGFSASQKEGDPVHYTFSKKFGYNLFLNRLSEHGIDTTEPLVGVTAEKLWNSAKEAYVIGKQLGDSVILMATSTGATLALKLAAEYPGISGLILLSPNIAINDGKAWMLNNHWGMQIAKFIKGKYNYARDTTAVYAKYWDAKYRIESVVQLQELLESTMKESTFKKISAPVLVLYYYKDEANQDKVVKVPAMKRMFAQLATPDSLKRMLAVPNAGDHVIGSYVKSKDVETVNREVERFAKEILKLKTGM